MAMPPTIGVSGNDFLPPNTKFTEKAECKTTSVLYKRYPHIHTSIQDPRKENPHLYPKTPKTKPSKTYPSLRCPHLSLAYSSSSSFSPIIPLLLLRRPHTSRAHSDSVYPQWQATSTPLSTFTTLIKNSSTPALVSCTDSSTGSMSYLKKMPGTLWSVTSLDCSVTAYWFVMMVLEAEAERPTV